jgi:hypothetical protein
MERVGRAIMGRGFRQSCPVTGFRKWSEVPEHVPDWDLREGNVRILSRIVP